MKKNEKPPTAKERLVTSHQRKIANAKKSIDKLRAKLNKDSAVYEKRIAESRELLAALGVKSP